MFVPIIKQRHVNRGTDKEPILVSVYTREVRGKTEGAVHCRFSKEVLSAMGWVIGDMILPSIDFATKQLCFKREPNGFKLCLNGGNTKAGRTSEKKAGSIEPGIVRFPLPTEFPVFKAPVAISSYTKRDGNLIFAYVPDRQMALAKAV
jgi:hypothetical protein